MGSRLGAALRRVVGIEQQLAPSADSRDVTPVQADGARDSGAATCVPATDSADPVAHARALLRWLQTEGGASGEVLAGEIQAAYAEMCAEHGWCPLSWLRVGKQFARIVGPRRYRDIRKNGERRRRLVYVVPAHGEIVTTEARRKHPSAPLPQRLSAIESAIDRLADQIGALVAAGGATGAGHVPNESHTISIDRSA